MPGWHAATKRLVDEGQLAVLGVTQEQHAERCRLFAQWQGFSWPILHDPLNVLELRGVPMIVAIDENGFVADASPDVKTFASALVDAPAKTAPADAADVPSLTPATDVDRLRRLAREQDTAGAWRALGDGLVLWRQGRGATEAIAAYQRALLKEPDHAATRFRLGVALRMRLDSDLRQDGDFHRAVESWFAALDADPNQYIWRRRIQQYGPRLTKPYPFYDWVQAAMDEIRARGEAPIELPVIPSGAEIASPAAELDVQAADDVSPDPRGRIIRDEARLIGVETAVVPPVVRAGDSLRMHVTMRPDRQRDAHWNNEAEPLRVWLELPSDWQAERRLLTAPQGAQAETSETRHLEVEVQLPREVSPGQVEVPLYAVYYVCEGKQGTCLFVRQDFSVTVEVR